MRKNYIYIFAILLFITSCNFEPASQKPAANIIPQPLKLEVKSGGFIISEKTTIIAEKGNPEAFRIAELLAEKINRAGGSTFKVEEGESPLDNSIFFTSENAGKDLGKEGYLLSVSEAGVVVKALNPAGLFYGFQSICQLLPAEIESMNKVPNISWKIPAVEIKDMPRYSWRGLHLDVGRHFMPVDFIKKHIDNMAMHKLNTFHWHLTEDQGWRIEIKKYPKLTEVGSVRKETVTGHNCDLPRKYDGKEYGGYYTQEEVKEIVRYAANRFITVVPEIELPGHATAAIAAYPELGVSGKQIDVAMDWGIHADIFNADDNTFLFLENVLTEVMELFPSEYIHIGGDEAIKDQWIASPKIQKQIKALGLKDEDELQSYYITRIEKFINSKGRKLIGWDEILEGGLAPNAAVMSWRGISGGIAAAKAKHYVVMSPGTHVYFDHYQGLPSSEPLAIAGYSPLKKVYSYEPTPDSLTDEEAKYILGAQANVWTEYMKSPEQVEYMVFPRISALAEVVWSQKENRNWDNFAAKLPGQLKRYELRGINYAKSIYDVSFTSRFDTASGKFLILLENELNEGEIRYTLDGSEPSVNSILYKDGIELKQSAVIKAGVFKDARLSGKVTEQSYYLHKAFGKKAVLQNPYNPKYNTHDFTLTDGLLGSNYLFTGLWQQYRESDLVATIDLGKRDTVKTVSANFVQLPHYKMLLPKNVEIFLSDDGKTFVKAGSASKGIVDAGNPAAVKYRVILNSVPSRYVRVVAKNEVKIIAKSGQVFPALLMADEIIVE